MARYTLWEAIAPRWHGAFMRAGMPEEPTVQQVAAWKASRPARPPLPPELVEATARRAKGESVAAIAADIGMDPSNLSSRLSTGVPALLTPWLEDVPAWRLGREQGRSIGELAELYEAPEHLVAIALDGWPDPRAAGSDLADDALQLWRDGADLDDIATTLDVPSTRLRRWVQDGTVPLTPARLRSSQLVERFGWSPHMVTLYRQRGVLPTPDGQSPVPWWWSSTIAQVERRSLTHQCQACGAKFASAKGLAMHTHVHAADD